MDVPAARLPLLGLRLVRPDVEANLNPLLSPDSLKTIRARAEAATPGPWKAGCLTSHSMRKDPASGYYIDERMHAVGPGHSYEDPGDANSATLNDASFIAHSRTDIPALLDHIAELERRLKWFEKHQATIESALERADWEEPGEMNDDYPGHPCQRALRELREIRGENKVLGGQSELGGTSQTIDTGSGRPDSKGDV